MERLTSQIQETNRDDEARTGGLPCATCGDPCPLDDQLVAFCEECLSASDLGSYPDGWVMLGGWD